MATTTVRRPAPTAPSARRTRAAPRRSAAKPDTGRQAASAESAPKAPQRPVLRAVAAAEQATRRNMTRVTLPVVGELHLPAAEEMAFLGGLVVLTAIGVLEWPVAVLLGAGHTLAMTRRNKVVQAFGQALEEA